MFEEVLLKAGYTNFNKGVNITRSYYFVLIHHENKHIIDYSHDFDTNYKFLYLVSIKDSNMNEINIYDKKLSFINRYVYLWFFYFIHI